MVPVAPDITGVCSYTYFACAVFILKVLRIIIIIIIIIIISFMQGIYTYIPETNYVPREYSVAAFLLLLLMVLISLVYYYYYYYHHHHHLLYARYLYLYS